MIEIINEVIPTEWAFNFLHIFLNMLFLLNSVNSSAISLVGINGLIYREENCLGKKDYWY